ncbi:MAG: ABC transporter ATP-binding protein, partial [Nocardia sp.]|nr:ABC transporter ATP-binding protein [Nocardia sp.]
EVADGEVHGFLGPNGAGKSTTIRILLGILARTSGQARVLGRDPWTDAVALHRDIAYVPGDVTLWPSLSGGETIDLLGRMRGGIDTARRADLIERFELDPRKKARTYSKGNRQKVALVSALSSRARLLLLDEPTSGLDPLMEKTFRECVREATERGVTVLLSSHILSEVETLCERVTIIRAGKTVESGSLARMRHLSRTSITAELTGDPGDLSVLPGVEDVAIEGRTLRCQVDSEHLGTLIRVLGDTGVRSLVSAPPTLEELFLRHYSMGGNAADGSGPARDFAEATK